MKCLVTGGAGLSVHLVKRLLKDGYEVTSVDNYLLVKRKSSEWLYLSLL